MILVRVIDGVLKKGMEVRFHQTNTKHLIERIGCFTPKMVDNELINAGELGFITAAIKEVAQTKVGDTILLANDKQTEPLPGFKPSQPVVFCGLFPTNAADFKFLKDALAKFVFVKLEPLRFASLKLASDKSLFVKFDSS